MGEIIVQDPRGVSDFDALRAAIPWEPHRLGMFAFDLLFMEGADVRRLPLMERREKLRWLLPTDPSGALHFSDHFEGEGAEYLSGPALWAWRGSSQSGRSALIRAGRANPGRAILTER
jgi:bifunctional non-homologous end joining protein LigD